MRTRSEAGEHWAPPGADRARQGGAQEQRERPRSSFLYRLEGVASHAAALDRPPNLTLCEGQSLSFAYRFGYGSFALDVTGYATGDNVEAARESAGSLRRNLEYFLSRVGQYRFAPAVVEQRSTRFAWQVRLMPAGVVVRASDPIGFGTVGQTERPVMRLPCGAPESQRVDWLPRTSGRDVFEVLLSVEPLPQPSVIRAAAEQFLEAARTFDLSYSDGTTVHDSALAASCFAWLSALARLPWALQVRCEVRAERALPDTMLATLGAAVYGDQPVKVVAYGAAEPTLELDLREVVLTGVGSNLLPGLPGLIGLGVPSLPPDRVPCRTSPVGVVLGHAGSGANRRIIRSSDEDRAQHCWIIGATGTGKSTLLYQMIRADIERGAGVCLLDPHGDLYAQVLEAVPDRRLPEMIPIDVAATERAVGINFLQGCGGNAKIENNFLINEMIQIFSRLYDMRVVGGPVFEQYMRNALALSINNTCAGATLMDIPLIFESNHFREALLNTCTDPLVVSFWREIAAAATGDAGLKNMGPYITSKLNRFTTNALLRPIIGQAESTLSFGECMDKGRIVLINLAKGQLGGLDARLLGMLIMGLIFNAALRRANSVGRRPFYLYVDEAQTFTTETVAELFAEARKFGLHLTLANQNLNQLAGNDGSTFTDSLLGNVGTLLTFRLGPPDAERLARYMAPEVSAIDLQDLPNYYVAARMLVQGAPERPFVLRTESPVGRCARSDRELAQRATAIDSQWKRFSRESAEVDLHVQQRKRDVLRAAVGAANSPPGPISPERPRIRGQ